MRSAAGTGIRSFKGHCTILTCPCSSFLLRYSSFFISSSEYTLISVLVFAQTIWLACTLELSHVLHRKLSVKIYRNRIAPHVEPHIVIAIPGMDQTADDMFP